MRWATNLAAICCRRRSRAAGIARKMRGAGPRQTGLDLDQCLDFDPVVCFQRVSDPRNAISRLSRPPTRCLGGLFSGVKMASRRWTEDEVRRAHDMREAGHSYGKIDKTLGRFPGATQQRLEIAGHGSGNSLHVTSRRVPDNLLAERAAREVARNQRSLTQDFCGDPPPGYSALHGKKGQQ
jgi:hypothetical protein